MPKNLTDLPWIRGDVIPGNQDSQIARLTTSTKLAEAMKSEKDWHIGDWVKRGESIRHKNIEITGDVEWTIHAEQDVLIHGNVMGYNSGAMRTMEYRMVTIIKNGSITSDTGNIQIKGHVNNAHLEARNGIVQISRDIVHSTIIAKRVEIPNNVTVFDCTIIAEEIIIWGKVINCHLLSGENIDIAESSKKWDYENIFNIFSRDLSISIEKRQKKLLEEMESLWKYQEIIFVSIVKNIPILAGISDKEKQLWIIEGFIEIFLHPWEFDPLYQIYLPLFQKLDIEGLLRKLPVNWEIFQLHRSHIFELTKSLSAEREIMGTIQQIHIHIGDIQWSSSLQWIRYQYNKTLLQFTNLELDRLVQWAVKWKAPIFGTLDEIEIPQSGLFNWKPSKE